MAITILPSGTVHTAVDIPICFQGSAIIVIPQEDARYLDLPPSDINWSYNITNGTWINQGALHTSTVTMSSSTVYGFQPFYISAVNWTFVTPPAPDRFYDAYWGVFDDLNKFYGWHLFKNCGNQSTTACGGPNSDNSRWQAFVIVADVPIGFIYVNFKEGFRLRSDGINLIWDYLTAGNCPGIPSGGWCTGIQRQTLPTSNLFRFGLLSSYTGNEISFITTFKGTYQGNIPLTWTAPLGGTLTGTGNNRCFLSNVAGTYQVCGDSDFDDPVCVDVIVDDLYIHAIAFDCGADCVFINDVISFESNGGEQGILTALDENGFNVGTVVGPLSWQAPDAPAVVTITYTVGTHAATCVLQVVDRFQLTNVVGDTIIGLGPGDVFQITDNYTPAGGTVVWENLSCPGVITADGTITIPKIPGDACFGALDCYVRGRILHVPGATCTNLDNEYFEDVRIVVDPIYPTPQYGGPVPTKWKPETPDFRVVTNQFEGGCSETYIRNRVPVYRWTVNYDGLMYDTQKQCPSAPCCDDSIGFVGGFDGTFQTAERIDDFWNFVMGTAGYFTLVDTRTGKIWRKVRFDSAMTRDHVNWRKTQSRTLTMIWNPCCETEPAGGVCEHISTITDGIAPTVPQNLHIGVYDIIAPSAPTSLAALTISETEIDLSWVASTDNVGVNYYTLQRATNAGFTTGLISTNVGNVTSYSSTGLTAATTYYYRVAAVDFSGNQSAWSSTASSTTSAPSVGFVVGTSADDYTTAVSGAIDTTGANLLVISVGYFNVGHTIIASDIVDSKGNTWTALTEVSSVTDQSRLLLFYTANAITGTGHTFTVGTAGNGGYVTFTVAAFNNVGIVSPFDQENHNETVSGTTVQSGSVTPSLNNELIVTSMRFHPATFTDGSATINSGFTVVDSRIGTAFGSPSSAEALAYKVQTTAIATNPTWTSPSPAQEMLAVIATFKGM